MKPEQTTRIKALKRALASIEQLEERTRKERQKAERRLGVAIARELGIVVGRRYKILPTERQAFTAVVKEIGTAWKSNSDTVSILVHLERKRTGAFHSTWINTNGHEFIPVPDEAKP